MNNRDRDRRQHPRFPSKVEMEGLPDGGGVFARMQTENLSLGGVYCSSSHDFPEMTRLAVRLRLPLDDRRIASAMVDAEAVVVRRELIRTAGAEPEYRLALYFTGMDERGVDLLARYLDTLN